MGAMFRPSAATASGTFLDHQDLGFRAIDRGSQEVIQTAQRQSEHRADRKIRLPSARDPDQVNEIRKGAYAAFVGHRLLELMHHLVSTSHSNESVQPPGPGLFMAV